MRAAILALLAVLPSISAFALPVSDGNIVRGKYSATGHASVSGIRVTYGPSKVHINNHGRVRGYITRTVTSQGLVLQRNSVRLRGNLRSLRIRRGAFTANTMLHIADGSKISGEFHGLIDPSQKLSRYFKGKISGSNESNFKLQAR